MVSSINFLPLRGQTEILQTPDTPGILMRLIVM